jgi:hypothetical protein
LQQRKSNQRYYTTETQGGFSSVEPFTTATNTTTTTPVSALSSAGNTIRYDETFFNLCRKRLEEKSDTSPYFQYCKEDPVRQASVFMVHYAGGGCMKKRSGLSALIGGQSGSDKSLFFDNWTFSRFVSTRAYQVFSSPFVPRI